jgi:serine/threonine-protein kinase RsbW
MRLPSRSLESLEPALHYRVPALPARAATLRQLLCEWAGEVGVPPDTRQEIALAAYEAMANVVVHAYPPGTSGVLELQADLTDGVVTVVIRDEGQWQPPPDDPGPLHGRGLPLIRELSLDSRVSPGPEGTTVRMTWSTTGSSTR